MAKKQKDSVIKFSIFSAGKAKVIAEITIEPAKEAQYQQLAMQWRYKMRQRHRWATEGDFTRGMERQASDALAWLGLNPTHLRALAQGEWQDDDGFLSSLIEVAIPWSSEFAHWWARVLPWEFLIASGTKKYRSYGKRVVVRRLVFGKSALKLDVPQSFAILEAAPGDLRVHYDFTGETSMIGSALPDLVFANLHRDSGPSPTSVQVTKWLLANKPDILHVTGIDTKLGAELLGILPSERDGLYLASARTGDPELLDAEAFASAITPESYAPKLLALNLWNSGARMAPLAIARGVGAAIGFENTFDDNVAERFFAQLYAQYSASTWSLGKAFVDAFMATSPLRRRTRGSSIILWTRTSLLTPMKEEQRDAISRGVPQRIAKPGVDQARDFIRVEARPCERLNYADLHNRGSIMDKLSIGLFPNREPNRDAVTEIRDIEVEVNLSAGSESFPYQTKLDLVPDENVVDLANTALEATDSHAPGGIHVPLTSDLMRSVDESLLTSVHVCVNWASQTIYRRTFPVQLAPVDEWRFEDDQIIWMSSFVHPRDAAVAKIIDSAQRYLACLNDEYTAGFSGYQAYDPDADEPWRGVDLQVQAIWTAISLDFGLSYINPPPCYSDNAQRLRTPTRILEERRGTCVDLALLMAACLEWIEIYPVIFNLNDHAFPGYWRNTAEYDIFQSQPIIADDKGTEQDSEGVRNQTLPPWYSSKSVYAELRSYVNPAMRPKEKPASYEARRGLIPMETVFLTQRSGFQAAVNEARGYFSKTRSSDFHSMIDVCRSRSRVTPIPLSALRRY
jgi:hypothetical protein